MKSGKIKFLFLISTLLLVLIVGTSAVSAQDEDRATPGSGSIWTTHGDCGADTQDANSYEHGMKVFINGDNFLPGDYDWAITGQPGQASTDPRVDVAFGTYTVVSDGTFCFEAYTIADDDGGEYSVDFGKKNDNYGVEPGPASFSYNITTCVWSPSGGSIRSVSLTINGASVTITGGGKSYGPYTTSQTINLPAGTYHYEWEAANKFFTGSDSGDFTVDECPPASASYEVQGCTFDNGTLVSTTTVAVTVSNAVLTIKNSSNAIVATFATNGSVDLPAGSYTYSWIANSGYSNMSSGSFTLLTCEPGKADAGVDIGSCSWDAQNGSKIDVILTLNNAKITFDGGLNYYTTSQTIKLDPGIYHYEWESIDPNEFEGSGSDDITVYGCEPASGSVEVGACAWNGEQSMTPVYISVYGATLKVYQGAVLVETYGPGSYTLYLPEGSYTYEWTANDNFINSGSGSFSTVNCEPGKADAAVEVGACVYDNGQSITTVVITLSNAKVTINGKDYIENAELKLAPGDYPYSWESISTDFVGSGEGVVTVGSCTPKDYDEPDIAAGGVGPSFIASAAPALLTISGLGLAWVLIKNRIKKTN